MQTRNDLELVNFKVNLLPYRIDALNYFTPEFWQRISIHGSGDCEDFAIEKYHRLFLMGWPLSALRLATCWITAGHRNEDYHAVTIVRFEDADFCLCNRYPRPMEISLLSYEFHKIQVAESTDWEYEKQFAVNHPELCIS